MIFAYLLIHLLWVNTPSVMHGVHATQRRHTYATQPVVQLMMQSTGDQAGPMQQMTYSDMATEFGGN